MPFGPAEAAAYATLLVDAAHSRGMAVAQKNTLELDQEIGFDFLVIESCGELGECAAAAQRYGDEVLAVEYDAAGFAAACDEIGEHSSVILRDLALSPPGGPGHRYEEC